MPVHAGGAAVENLEAVHPDVAHAGLETAGENQRQGHERSGIFGPAVQYRQLPQIHVLSLENNLLAGRRLAAETPRKKTGYRKGRGQQSQHITKTARRRNFHQVAHTLAQLVQVFDPESHADASRTAKKIGGRWKG